MQEYMSKTDRIGNATTPEDYIKNLMTLWKTLMTDTMLAQRVFLTFAVLREVNTNGGLN